MKSQLKLIAYLLMAGTVLSAYASIPQSPEALKAALSNPLLLLGVMFAGALVSGLKTIGTAKRDGSSITIGGYFGYLPETFGAVLAVFVAWGGLLIADQLNFAAAAAYGAVANTSVDLLRSGGRSAALAVKKPEAP